MSLRNIMTARVVTVELDDSLEVVNKDLRLHEISPSVGGRHGQQVVRRHFGPRSAARAALPSGTPWTTGCSADSFGNHAVYELQAGGTWLKQEASVGTQVAVSPAGNAWAISTLR